MKWKQIKDIFTLAKNWSEVFKSFIVWQQSKEKERKIYIELDSFNSCLVGDPAHPGITKLVKSLIK